MKCPKCGEKIRLDKYLVTKPEGFLCSGCESRLKIDHSTAMLRYVLYLGMFLFLKYSFDLGVVGIVMFLLLVASFDFLFIAKATIVDKNSTES